MNFLHLSGGLVALGLLGLAGVLFLLQQLRVRQREVEVVTTLFWREALEENRARVLRQRFRHPWAYLLLLAITSLLWLALAGLVQGERDVRPRWLMLDASAGMLRDGRFDAAKEQLLADVARLDASERRVYWMGAGVELLLAPGEEVPLLAARLEGRTPELVPPLVAASLARWATEAGEAAPEVLLYGDAPIDEATRAALPADWSLHQRTAAPETVAANRGILAAGVGEAASGRWDRVDLTVAVAAQGLALNEAVAALEVELDGAAFELEMVAVPGGDEGLAMLRAADLPAEGGVLELRLPAADGFAADDAVQLHLPERRPLRVALSPDLDPLLGSLLSADPAVVLTRIDADVQVVRTDDAMDLAMPRLVIHGDDGGALFRLQAERGDDAQLLLEEAYEALGLGSIDALGLATSLGRAVTVDAAIGGPAEIRLADALLDPELGFTGSRAFPLLITRALRWLRPSEALLPYVAAGRAVPSEATRLLGAPQVMGAAGEAELPTHGAVAVGLFAPAASLPADRRMTVDDLPAGARAGIPAWTWLVLLALILLVFEGLHYRRGRMP
ncbi:MAG: hypothetical protein ACPGQD_00280 [Planctomycetota bacterium]